MRVARKLHQRLHGKKYLLLLDDVWEMVDLVAVGFPNPTQDSGCKVVLTTRKLEVCRKMGTDTEVKVKVLQEEEAREMFYANVEDVVKLPDIKPLAEKIVRECDGLPLALKVVSEDSKIDKAELIEYLRAEGILSRDLTFAEAFDQGDAILQALIDASLLEKGYDDDDDDDDDDDLVKMHDVVRDLVLAMTSPKGEEPQHLVRAGISSGKIPDAVEWKKATRISFMDNDLRKLPNSPDCPKLLTFLLQLLSCCKSLKAVPAEVICKLSQLEVFKLNTHLNDESQEIVAKELSNLNTLSDLEFDFGTVVNLQHFVENSISWKERLTKFQFLINVDIDKRPQPLCEYLTRSFNRWLCYGGGGEEERGSNLPSAMEDVLSQSYWFIFIGHGKLSTFSEVGVCNMCELKWCIIRECDALEKIVNRNGLEMGAFPNLEHLDLVNLSNLKTILCLEEEGPLLPLPPNANTFTNLKSLRLINCPSIEQLFSSGFMVQQLSTLEELEVRDCRGLKGMIPDDQKLDCESLPKLRMLQLEKLPEFDSLFKGVHVLAITERGVYNELSKAAKTPTRHK
ncbi:hypothetical protein Vadar_018500 [Vaccinium darrowii]|uniref:Uncharacterized protein n=1 Tax=Vaccinium darrowii TaxID=229202 RepID=A0ACB7X1S8_9ERIC|nr:hypothetical protein Vadar_018500 [Vaccinium darrowii]